jgi:hypothetical protein
MWMGSDRRKQQLGNKGKLGDMTLKPVLRKCIFGNINWNHLVLAFVKADELSG